MYIKCLLLLDMVVCIYIEFCYGIFGVPERYLEVPKVSLISAVDFYYVINKLIILVSDPH
jgi:hypothetical protein